MKHKHPTNDRTEARQRIRAARERAAELLEERREQVRRDLEQRTRELSEHDSAAATMPAA